MKKQTHKLSRTQNKIPLLNLRMRSMRASFVLIQNEEKNVGPVTCNLPLHDKRQSVSAGTVGFDDF